MPTSRTDSLTHQIRWLWLLYTAFIIYGTLMPFYRVEGITVSEIVAANLARTSWLPFFNRDGSRPPIPDMIQNVIFFLPFGFLGYFSFRRHSWIGYLAIVTAGMTLSFTVETLQLTTLYRITSPTDVATNTIGTILGLLIANSANLSIQQTPASLKSRLRESRMALLFLAALIITLIGALAPFDFSLDAGIVGWKLNHFLRQPFRLNTNIRDEFVVGFRFFLLGCSAALFFRSFHKSSYPWAGTAFAIGWAIALECSQFIVTSRIPTFQDAVVAVVSSLLGGLFSFTDFKKVPRLIWTTVVILVTAISSAVHNLAPFQWNTHYRSLNWVPFFLHFDRTSLASISNFNQSALVYFPLGFLLQSIYPARSVMILISAIIAGAIAFPLEITQGWVVGRYPNITDVIGAIAGALLGSWISWHYEERRRSTIEQPLKPQLSEDSPSPSLRQSSSGDST